MTSKRIFIVFFVVSSFFLFSQEVLLSTEENYYNFLALDGTVKRPYLNYRTLSDSAWTIPEGTVHPWNSVNLGTKRNLSDSVAMKIYGPSWFSSFNSAAPYGQNDGVLWQGKGYNSSLTAGARLEAYGFELTLKPEVVFSQNMAFDLIQPAYKDPVNPDPHEKYIYYTDKADTYGYFGVRSIDAPQRFGNAPFFDFSWGDSEIRYTWKSLTAGFGTQNIWLGPARVNPILHSNNAAPYPKIDIGLRPTSVIVPWLGWDLGEVEGRVWCGRLTESKWFDLDSSNNHNMISALSLAWAPSFLPGLTLSANRNYLAPWNTESLATIPAVFFVKLDGGGAQDVWDQRASLAFSWLSTAGSIEVYGELGINDYCPSIDGYIRYPFHSMVYMGGLRKKVELPLFGGLPCEINAEWLNMEMSQIAQFCWPNTFYAHHQITQGYTSSGQWLGAGNGSGGNSQFLEVTGYLPKGNITLFVHRSNPDNDYIYAKSVYGYNPRNEPSNTQHIQDFKAVLSYGCEGTFNINSILLIQLGITSVMEHNPVYQSADWSVTNKRFGLNLITKISWML